MGKVVILTTGGTIAGTINKESGRLTSGTMAGEELISRCLFSKHRELIMESVFQKAGSHLSFEDLVVLILFLLIPCYD